MQSVRALTGAAVTPDANTCSAWCKTIDRRSWGQVTNVLELADKLTVCGAEDHGHACLGHGTPEPTERYTPELVTAILVGSQVPEYRDVYTGVGPNPHELGFAASPDVWEPRPRAQAQQRMELSSYGTRWLDHNKIDAARLEYSSGHVGDATNINNSPRRHRKGRLHTRCVLTMRFPAQDQAHLVPRARR